MSEETPLRHTEQDDALVRALHAAYDDAPSEAELRALEAGVLGAIQSGGGGGGGAPAMPKSTPWTTPLTTPLISALAIGAAVAVVAVGVHWMAPRGESEGTPQEGSVTPFEVPDRSEEMTTPDAIPTLPQGVEPPREVSAAPARVRPERPAVAPEVAEQVLVAEVESEDETVLLRRATSMLQAHPSEALALTERMARVPHPEWAEERERVAIEALVHLARRPEAEARLARFQAMYPNSAYATRLRDVLSEVP